MEYGEFLAAKAITARRSKQKIDATSLHGFLYDFQFHLVSWAIERGRAAIFADCGLGKTAMQLSWADIVSQSLGRPVLILAPLSVVSQTIEEASRFGIEATIEDRCSKVAEIANADSSPFVAWCSLNDESRLLTSMIDGAIEVSGSMSDEEKEDAFDRFRKGTAKAIVTKPSMAAFGMNWQHCHRMSFFPSHSHEQFYQAVRRCWRFGQKMPVDVHIVTTESESAVIDNLKRKEKQSIELFDRIVENMGAAIRDAAVYCPSKKVEAPSWL